MAQIILASASPRRRELLQQIGIRFVEFPVDLDETPIPTEPPLVYVQRMAAEKSQLVQQQIESALPILAADTTVVNGGIILGKPVHREACIDMLQQLSNTTHQVYTAVSLRLGTQHWETVSRTDVRFRALSLDEINQYWETGEPQDKAGAYAIQGLGCVFVAAIRGSFSGVVGLPLFETARLLEYVGIKVIHD